MWGSAKLFSAGMGNLCLCPGVTWWAVKKSWKGLSSIRLLSQRLENSWGLLQLAASLKSICTAVHEIACWYNSLLGGGIHGVGSSVALFKVIHTMQSSCFSIPLPCWILISFQEWAAVSMLHWKRKADTPLLMGEELLCWNCHGELFQLKRMRGQSTWSNAVLPLGDSLLLADWLCCLSYVPRTALWQAALEECTCPKGKLTLCSAEPNYLFLS